MEFPEGLFKKLYIKIPGVHKKGVEFPGIKKNSCEICIGACLVQWNFQAAV